jgi:hypothetical protein
MGRYENLGTLAVRWLAVCFFILAFISVVFAGTMGMGTLFGGGDAGSMMGSGAGAMSGHMNGMTGGSSWMWWGGPTLVTLIIGLILYAVSRPLGRAIGSGLE